MIATDEDLIEISVKPLHEFFYSQGNNYGIYSVYLNDSENLDLIKYDEIERKISIVGSMQQLECSKNYIAHVREVTHPKFGLQYEAKMIYEKPMSTRAEQIVFLNTVLTEKQTQTISDAYPDEDIIELIKKDLLDTDLLKGIGEKVLGKIKDKIIANEKYQKAIIELSGKFGIPYNAIVKLSENYGSPDLLLEKINENPYVLTEVSGFGFKRVDEIALSMGIDNNSPKRVESCIRYLLEEFASNEGHVWMNVNKVVSESVKLLGLRIAEVQSILSDIIEEDSSGIKQLNKSLFLDRGFRYELEISLNLKRILDVKPTLSFDFDFKEAVEKVEERQGFKFTGEQTVAIQQGIENNILVVNGKAGTGKTSVIKGVIEVLKMHHESLMSKDSDLLKLEYATCALSGKASQRIQESTGLDAFTIHRLLGFNPREGWMFDEHNKLPYDVIVLDEASMVNSQLFYYLVRAIKDGAKIIITGDTAQLEPIGMGNVLVDILNVGTIPSVELTIVHRQAQKSGILSNANLVREGVNFFKGNPIKHSRLGELKDLYMYPTNDKDKVLSRVIAIASKYNGDIMEFQVLTPMKSRGNLSTLNLNNELQKIFNTDPEEALEHKKIKRKDSTLLEGDKVIINGNNYDKGVFNGTMGIIEHIETSGKGEIIINFEGVGRTLFKKDELGSIDLGYAITIHKSQGSQWKYVVLAFDYSSYVLLNRQLVYTGMTRAIEVLFFIVEVKALDHAINTDKSSKRNTFLVFLLSESIAKQIQDFIKSRRK